MKRRGTMVATILAVILAPGLIAAPAGPQPIGQYGRWGAFRTRDGAACYAIAQPERSGRGDGAYLTISSWPARRLTRQIHVRFRGDAKGGATLSIGGQRFALTTRGADGWPASPADGRRIALLMREGGLVRVVARIDGTRRRDIYAGNGAASAIDAADVVCLRER